MPPSWNSPAAAPPPISPPPAVVLDHCLPPSQKEPRRSCAWKPTGERKMDRFRPGAAGEPGRRRAAAFLFQDRRSGQRPSPPQPLSAAARPAGPPAARSAAASSEYREACRAGPGQRPQRHAAGSRQRHAPATGRSSSPASTSTIPKSRPRPGRRSGAQYRQGKCGIVCGGISAAPAAAGRNPGLLIVDRAASPLYQRTLRLAHSDRPPGRDPGPRRRASPCCAAPSPIPAPPTRDGGELAWQRPAPRPRALAARSTC